MLGLEGPTNERRERGRSYSVTVAGKLRLPLLRAVLLSPDALQMFDAVLDRLYMPEHHGGRRMQSEPMRNIHDLKPIITHGLKRRNALTNAVDENFASAAGN